MFTVYRLWQRTRVILAFTPLLMVVAEREGEWAKPKLTTVLRENIRSDIFRVFRLFRFHATGTYWRSSSKCIASYGSAAQRNAATTVRCCTAESTTSASSVFHLLRSHNLNHSLLPLFVRTPDSHVLATWNRDKGRGCGLHTFHSNDLHTRKSLTKPWHWRLLSRTCPIHCPVNCYISSVLEWIAFVADVNQQQPDNPRTETKTKCGQKLNRRQRERERETKTISIHSHRNYGREFRIQMDRNVMKTPIATEPCTNFMPDDDHDDDGDPQFFCLFFSFSGLVCSVAVSENYLHWIHFRTCIDVNLSKAYKTLNTQTINCNII